MAGRGWRAKRAETKPTDPRMRDVTGSLTLSKRAMLLTLSCGHKVKRRLRAPPSRIICTECPRGSGMKL